MSNLNSVYQQNLYHDKQKEIDELFYEYHFMLLNIFIILHWLKNENKNIDAADYEKKNQETKLPSKKK